MPGEHINDLSAVQVSRAVCSEVTTEQERIATPPQSAARLTTEQEGTPTLS